MDADGFDAFSRALHAARSRRGALAAALSGIGSLLGLAGTAAGKQHKKKPKYTTVTRTVRQLVTQTFANRGAIVIGDGNANPYSSAINVGGFVNGAITDVNLTLHTFSHVLPR